MVYDHQLKRGAFYDEMEYRSPSPEEPEEIIKDRYAWVADQENRYRANYRPFDVPRKPAFIDPADYPGLREWKSMEQEQEKEKEKEKEQEEKQRLRRMTNHPLMIDRPGRHNPVRSTNRRELREAMPEPVAMRPSGTRDMARKRNRSRPRPSGRPSSFGQPNRDPVGHFDRSRRDGVELTGGTAGYGSTPHRILSSAPGAIRYTSAARARNAGSQEDY